MFRTAVDDISSVFHLTATRAVLMPNMAMHIPILVDIQSKTLPTMLVGRRRKFTGLSYSHRKE